MPDSKQCPKCEGNMTHGTLMEKGKYGNSPYVWSPENDAPFPVKGAPSKRLDIVMYRCEACGFLELYAPPIAS